MAAVTRMMGKDIWQYTVIALTHGKVHPPTLEQTYGEPACALEDEMPNPAHPPKPSLACTHAHAPTTRIDAPRIHPNAH